MKNILRLWALTVVAFIIMIIPVLVVQAATGIENPIAAKSLQCLVLLIFKQVINIAAFVCVGFFIWAGFLYVFARGNPEKLKSANHALVNVIIGTVLIFGAWVFAQIISNTISQVSGTSSTTLSANQC